MILHWIEDEALAAGSIPASVDDIRALHQQGVRAILTLTEHPLMRFQGVDEALFDSLEINYFHTPVDDYTAPSVEQASKATQFINQMKALGKPVYVHCAAGIGRTGTMLHAYYVMEGLNLEDAKEKVREAKLSSQFLMLSTVQRSFVEDLARQLQPNTVNVVDLWHLPVLPGVESEFVQAFKNGERWLMSADGYVSHEMRRNSEQLSMYLVMIRWNSAQASQYFQDSVAYRAIERELQQYLLDDPLIEHYKQV